MDDVSRPASAQYQDSTRALLIVLVAVSVLAAGVLAVADVPDLVGDKWQAVGAASAGLTMVALLVAVFVVLRALDPIADDEPSEARAAVPVQVDGEVHSDPPGEEADGTAVDGSSRRMQRQVANRYHRARSVVGVAVVLAFLGMTGMTAAAVIDGNKVEERTRTALQEQLDAEEDGPITEPQAVAVQLTTPGLRRVAEAMGCTGQQLGVRPVQGWAVSGTYRNPVVVLFGPSATCKNVEIALAPRDGFVYPTIGVPTATTPTTATPVRPATTPTTAAAAPAFTPTSVAP